MSARRDTLFTSGSFRGTKEEFRTIFRNEILPRATKNAWTSAFRIYNTPQSIAFKLGVMNAEFKEAGQKIIERDSGKDQIRINQNEVFSRHVSAVPYAEHHWTVGPRGAATYAHPTRSGTVPINWGRFKGILAVEGRKALRLELQRRGFITRRRR